MCSRKEPFKRTFDKIDDTIKSACADIANDAVDFDDGIAIVYALIKSRNGIVTELTEYVKKYVEEKSD